MENQSAPYRNLWAVTVLSLIRAKPLHPYEMQRLIRQWHKDEFLVLKRGSLYHAITRLEEAKCIEPISTAREGKRPERTVYRMTARGEEELLSWLRQMLATPVREPSEFVAVVSFLAHLAPEDVVTHLQERVQRLGEEIAGLDTTLSSLIPQVGRLVLLEIDYVRAMRQAEKNWVEGVVRDIHEGRLDWNVEAILQWARKEGDESHERANG